MAQYCVIMLKLRENSRGGRCHAGRYVRPRVLFTNQEVWEFESPRALHQQGVGKLGSIRLPWKQEIAGSKPASLTNSGGGRSTGRASCLERDRAGFESWLPHQDDDVAEC